MSRNNPQTERQLDIDRKIRAKHYPSIPELAAVWEVGERTIKRDIEFMRDRLHAPIEYDRKRGGYFYSEPTWGIPAVFMREEELIALMLARLALEQYRDLPFGEIFGRLCDKILETSNFPGDPSKENIYRKFSFIRSQIIAVSAEKGRDGDPLK